jgi:peptidoglycan-N-acetylglucosamine deacetylase
MHKFRLLLRQRHKVMSLTFDDGPDEKTQDILELLRANGARATFFILGRQVAGRESIVRRLVEAGNEVGNHTYSHPHLESLEIREIERELSLTSDVIERAAAVRPRLMRPPYGLDALRAAPIAAAQRMKTILWSVNTKDWNEPDPTVIATAILEGAAPGAVVVLHDGAANGGDRSRTVEALAIVLPALRAQGYRLVTVSELFERAPWAARKVIPKDRSGVVRRGLRAIGNAWR